MSSLADREAGLGAQRYVGQVVRAPKTAELIATLYRRQIVRGELRPGDTLPSEQQLMEQFGVSRPTLREAFRILEAEDLISVKRGSRGGARVTQPSLSVAARYVGLLLQVQGTTIADVYEARMVLEPACARLLARRRTKQDLADLNACIEELRGAVEAGQPGDGPARDGTAQRARTRALVQPGRPVPRADHAALRQQDAGRAGRRAAGHRGHPSRPGAVP